MIGRTLSLHKPILNKISRTAGILPGLAFGLLAAVSVAAQTSATFVWQPNAEGDLAGYRFYQEHGQPVQRTVTKLGLVGRHTVSNLVLGRTYRFYLTAFNKAGLESAPSQAVTLTAGTGTETTTTQPLPQELAAIVIDNTDTAAVTRTGEWAVSTSNGPFWGANYLHDRSSGKGSKSVEYSATLAYSGTYEVAVWYSVGSTTSASVPVDITHAGGTTRISINQRQNGGQWLPLGSFAFDSSRPARVRISNEGTSGHVIADAVRLRPVSVSLSETATPTATSSPPPEDPITTSPSLQTDTATETTTAAPLPEELAAIVIDNTDTAAVTRTGDWAVSTSNGPFWGANYLHDRSSGKGSKSVEYTATLAYSGTYEVALYYSVGSTRSTSVPVDITHAGGTTRISVNQRLNGSQWFPLGSFAFDSSRPARVRISNEGTSGHVIADAVRLRPVSGSLGKTAALPIADFGLPPGDLITTFPSLQFSRLPQLDHALQLTWPTVHGSAYELEQTDDLNNPWTVIANLIGGGEAAAVIVEDLDNKPRFWRVKGHSSAAPGSPGSVTSTSWQSPAPAD